MNQQQWSSIEFHATFITKLLFYVKSSVNSKGRDINDKPNMIPTFINSYDEWMVLK